MNNIEAYKNLLSQELFPNNFFRKFSTESYLRPPEFHQRFRLSQNLGLLKYILGNDDSDKKYSAENLLKNEVIQLSPQLYPNSLKISQEMGTSKIS